MKKIVLCFLALALMVGSASAQVDIFYSTSNSDSAAGTTLELVEGTSGSIYVWVTNNDDEAIDGLGIDMLSSDAAILEATAHTIADPGGRWFSANGGDLNDLVTDSVSIALIGLNGDGIANDGTPVLHSEIQFDATAIGTTDLSIVENGFAISVSGDPANSLNFGNATVNVVAVPEPASAMVVAGLFGGLLLRRRRS